jgi:hypothetical protein
MSETDGINQGTTMTGKTDQLSFEAFSPRPITFAGILNTHGYELKSYRITAGGAPFRKEHFEEGLSLAFSSLLTPARSGRRPGLGFVIAHQGKDLDYIVLSWWDRENELPTRVFVRDDTGWRPARQDESFCVWDLEIIWHERQSYIRTLLSPVAGDNREVYLLDYAGFPGDAPQQVI